MMKIRNQKGFTLLEIMLVVLIIGIIALLALPRLLVTRRIAQEQTCLGDQSAIRTHLEAYKWDWGTYPDDGSAGAANPLTATAADDFGTEFLINTRYWPLGDPAPRRCPVGNSSLAGHLDGSWVYDVVLPLGDDSEALEYTLACPNAHAAESSM